MDFVYVLMGIGFCVLVFVIGGSMGWQDAISGKDWLWKKQRNVWPRR